MLNLTWLMLSNSSMCGLYPWTVFSYWCNLPSWSSSDPRICIVMEATASSWFSIHLPTTLALAAKSLRSLSFLCCLAISFCSWLSRDGTSWRTSCHLLAISWNGIQPILDWLNSPTLYTGLNFMNVRLCDLYIPRKKWLKYTRVNI